MEFRRVLFRSSISAAASAPARDGSFPGSTSARRRSPHRRSPLQSAAQYRTHAAVPLPQSSSKPSGPVSLAESPPSSRPSAALQSHLYSESSGRISLICRANLILSIRRTPIYPTYRVLISSLLEELPIHFRPFAAFQSHLYSESSGRISTYRVSASSPHRASTLLSPNRPHLLPFYMYSEPRHVDCQQKPTAIRCQQRFPLLPRRPLLDNLLPKRIDQLADSPISYLAALLTPRLPVPWSLFPCLDL